MKLLSLILISLLLYSCTDNIKPFQINEEESYSGIIVDVSNDHFKLNTHPNLKMRLFGAITCQKNQKAVAKSGSLVWPCGTVADSLFRTEFEGKVVNCFPKKYLSRLKLFVSCYFNSKDIAAELIKSGWAVAFRNNNILQEPKYLKHENDARIQRKGLWNSYFQWPNQYTESGNKNITSGPLKTPY